MKMYLPWRNLGCLGFRFGKMYFDIHRVHWGWLRFQIFISWSILNTLGLSKSGKGWVNQNGFKAMR